MATIARLGVEFYGDHVKYDRSVQHVERGNTRLTGQFSRLKQAAAALFVTGGLAIGARRMFALGSAAEETASKFRTVFGPATKEVQDFIDGFGEMAGLTQTQSREVVATTGAIVQGMGLAQDASAKFATEVVRLAGDLSSFNNIPIADTSRAIQAAITGEREMLKRLGIVVREEDVQKRALADTGKKLVSQLTQEEKAVATLAMITERAGVAVGDLARTQDSSANQARKLTARFANMRDTLATGLMPIFKELLDGLDNLTGGFDSSGAAGLRFQTFVITSISVVKELGVEAALAASALRMLGAVLSAPARTVGQFFGMKGPIENMKDAVAGFGHMRVAAAGMREEIRNETAAALADLLKTIAGVAAGANDAAGALNASAGGTSLAKFIQSGDVRAQAADWQLYQQHLGLVAERVDRLQAGWRNLNAGVQLSARSMRYFATYGQETIEGLKKATVDFAVRWSDAFVDASLRGAAAFRSFARSVMNDIARIAAKMAILEGLKRITSPEGSWFSHFVSALGSAWGEGRAAGGPVSANQAYMVGERGPELFVPQTAGRIVPGGAGQVVVNQHITIAPQFVDSRDGARWLRENQGEIMRIIGDGARRSSSYRAILAGV